MNVRFFGIDLPGFLSVRESHGLAAADTSRASWGTFRCAMEAHAPLETDHAYNVVP